MSFKKNKHPRLSLSVFFVVGFVFVSCGKSMTDKLSTSRILESRAPIPGETKGRPVITEDTFKLFSSGDRKNIEMESVGGLSGLPYDKIMDFAEFKEAGNSRTAFQRLATSSYAKAFAMGVVDSDKVPWNRKAHEIREGTPYIGLSVESGRLTYNSSRNELDVSVGTDFNVDMYYDTPDFLLLNNGMIARWRLRQDQPGQGRRALIQTKVSKGIDRNGLKQALKADIRNDSANVSKEFRDFLNLSVQSGTNVMNSSGNLETAKNSPLEAFKVIYTELLNRKLLPDLDGMKNVLLLNPQAVVFSKRARIHFNTSNVNDTVLEKQLTEVLNAVNANTAVSDALKTEIKNLSSKISDTASLLTEALPQAELEFPGSTAGFDIQKVAQEMKQDSTSILRSSFYVAHSFFKKKRELVQELSKKTAILGASFEVQRRKLEYAATSELTRWFGYVMFRFFGGYGFGIIDTFDFSYGVLKSDYDQLTENQKLMIEPIPRDKIIFASLVSEVQTELGDIYPENCFKNAKDENSKKMCTFLLTQINALQDHLSRLRGEEVLEMARRSGLPMNVKWENAEASKGENVLRIARKLPAPLPVLSPLPTP